MISSLFKLYLLDKFCNWVYIDPNAPEGVLFIYMTEIPVDAFEFCNTLKNVIKEPLIECAHPFTHLFTRADKAPNLNSTDETK